MTEPPRRPAPPLHFFLGAIVDAVAPLLTYLLLHAFGVSPRAALIFGSLAAVATTAAHTFRRKRLDAFGLLVIAEIGVAILLQFLLHDPRLLLIKPSFYSVVGAIYLAYSAFSGHPLTYEGARPMATQGKPERIAAYERAWRLSPAFRALHRTATLGWASAFLADAVLRVVIVFCVPMGRAVWLSNIPHVAAILLLVGFSARVGRKAQPLVEEQLHLPDGKPERVILS